MCGIVGICQLDNNGVDRAKLLAMRESVRHRGPDDEGAFISDDQSVGFGHRRLSIIDLTPDGRQPMSNEDGTVWITYNGEIYNYRALQRELQALGHRFKSKTDTEVIIHAYEEFGKECLQHFNGMFAFAIYDQNRKQVFAARDRFGIKPLYYLYKESRIFAFSSEIKAFVHCPYFQKTLNHAAVGEYFRYRYIPAPHTIWADVHKLPHGHSLTLDLTQKRLDCTQYYSLENCVLEHSPTKIDHVYQLLGSAVTDRLVASDVEVGVFLSGGLDSSTLTYLAAAKQPGIKTFSIDFQPEHFSELPYAESVSRQLGTEHFSESIADIENSDIQMLSEVFDQPLADNSCFPTYRLSRLARRSVKVALAGEGGDEVFAGYRWYAQWQSQNRASYIRIMDSLCALLGMKNSRFGFESQYSRALSNGLAFNKLKDLLTGEIYNDFVSNSENILEKFYKNSFRNVRQLQYVDLNTFLTDDLLSRIDLASMANSLEVRVPFLDHRLVEAVFSLKENDFPSRAVNKPLIRKFLKDKFSDEFIRRPKQGFGPPMYHWPYFKQIDHELLNGEAVRLGILNRKAIEQTLNNCSDAPTRTRWLFLVFEHWIRRWMNT